MKIVLTVVGKTTDKHFIASIDEYVRRINHYVPFSVDVVPELKGTKSLSEKEQKERKGELIFKSFQPGDYIVLLDEHGSERGHCRYDQQSRTQKESYKLLFVQFFLFCHDLSPKISTFHYTRKQSFSQDCPAKYILS